MREGAIVLRIPGVTVLLFAVMASISAAARPGPHFEVCHIANAGFALRGDGGTVLIDALFREGLTDYQRASDELNEKLETGAAPFDEVKFVIASHAHADHFHAGALVRHAENNAETHYIVTPQAADKMRAAGFPRSAGSRLHAVHPPNEEQSRVAQPGIEVTVFRISHGKGNPAQNIGTLVRMGRMSVFHTGDMEPYPAELREAGLENLGVDVALVPFWLLLNDDNRALVRKTFAAKTVIPMHVPDKEQDWMAEYGGLAGIRDLIESEVANAAWLAGTMECMKIAGPQSGGE